MKERIAADDKRLQGIGFWETGISMGDSVSEGLACMKRPLWKVRKRRRVLNTDLAFPLVFDFVKNKSELLVCAGDEELGENPVVHIALKHERSIIEKALVR